MQVARLGKVTQELEVEDPRVARIIKLENGGLTKEEIAEAGGVDVSAVKRDWRAARLTRLSNGMETGLNHTRRYGPTNFFLVNEPFSAGHALLSVKGGKAADINQPLRAVAQY
jgi:hypothetical protein